MSGLAQRRLDAITRELEAGNTVFVRSALKNIKVTARTHKRWLNDGLTMFKVSGNSLMMASGSKFVCIDYCDFTVEYKSGGN